MSDSINVTLLWKIRPQQLQHLLWGPLKVYSLFLFIVGLCKNVMNLKHLMGHKQEVYFVNVLKKKKESIPHLKFWSSVCGFYLIQRWLGFLPGFCSESQAGTQNFQTWTLVFRCWKHRSSLFQQLVLWQHCYGSAQTWSSSELSASAQRNLQEPPHD